MKEISYNKYKPNRTLEENAKRIGCSVSALKKHLKKSGVDIRFEEVCARWKRIQGFYKKNPDASLVRARRELGYSVNTIKKYKTVKYEALITSKRDTDKVSNYECQKNVKKTHLKPNTKKYPLASKQLALARKIMEFTDGVEVSVFRDWLHRDADKPLITIGNGGKHTTYPTLLYGMNQALAKAMTPLEFAAISPSTIKNSKILLMSSAGANPDILYAVQRAKKYNRENTAVFTFADESEGNKIIQHLDRDNVFIFKNRFRDGFTSISTRILTYGLLYKAFSGCDKISDKLNYNFNYDYYINQYGYLPELKNIRYFCLLYGICGEPIAHDVESQMTEAGVAPVLISDFRDFCHGRFIFSGNHCKSKQVAETDVCMIMLTSPREKKLVDGIRKKALPVNMPIVEIHTELTSSLGTIELLMNAMCFMYDLAENHLGINPNSPHNYSSVDKRVPKNSIGFASELKRFGELSHT